MANQQSKTKSAAAVRSSDLLGTGILKYSGCNDHPHRLDLSCAKIRRMNGDPLTNADIFEVLKKQERITDALCAFINREMQMTGSDPRIIELEKIIQDIPTQFGCSKLSAENAALIMGVPNDQAEARGKEI